ncbi:MAG: hypothetical protein SWQ30_04400 [Thermodesulfobacteriota bacterium]|nr:hypothetical protein [Thermodesulfobacteriota bacterium]
MTELKLIGTVLLSVVLAGFSGAFVHAEFHHVDDCSVCHYAGGAESTACTDCPNNVMIKCEIMTPNSGLKGTVFGPYVWTEDPYNGVCEACHTGTAYHRNNASGDHTHFAAENCTPCHKHSDEFTHGEGEACDTCHGHDGGAGTYQSHSTHTENDSDDVKGPNKTCDTCHDTDNYFHFADSATTLAATTVCDKCHSPDGAFDGVNDPDVGVKDNWGGGIYEADGLTLKPGKEKWCVTCHDDSPAFSQPVELPLDGIVLDDGDAVFVPDCPPPAGYPDSPPAGSPPHGDYETQWAYSWGTPTLYGNGYRFVTNSEGAPWATATWTPNITEAGYYHVYARWEPGSIYWRATNAPYTINYNGGSETIRVDQTQYGPPGGIWNYLGTYDFASGTAGNVVLSNDANHLVLTADAIMFVKAVDNNGTGPGAYAPKVAGDNSTWGFYATGHGKNGKAECLDCHLASRKHIDGNGRTYDVNGPGTAWDYCMSYRLPDGSLEVPRTGGPSVYTNDFSLCFSCHNNKEVLGVDGSDTTHTNFWDSHPIQMTINNAHRYHLNDNGSRFDSDFDQARYTDSRTTCVACHNVHGPPNPAMIRHGELISTSILDKRPAFDFSYQVEPPDPPATATYTAASLPGGDYEVYGWWTGGSMYWRANNATWTITDSAGPHEVTVNYTDSGPGCCQWNLLGTYSYTEGATGTVVIDNDFYSIGALVLADGVRWQQITAGTHEVILNDTEATYTDDVTAWAYDAEDGGAWDGDFTYIYAHLPLTDRDATLLTSDAGHFLYSGNNYVCTTCHHGEAIRYIRPPKAWPKVIFSPGASVYMLPSDGTVSTITVTIADPDNNVTGVTIDLSPVGGSASAPMTDNLDGTYTYLLSVDPGTPDMQYVFTITATDADLNTGSYDFKILVKDPNAIYVDDTEATMVPACNGSEPCDYTVEWTPSWDWVHSHVYGSKFSYKLKGDGSGTMTWTPTVPSAGNYAVYAWWQQGSIYWRSENVRYTVNHSGGSTPILVNQIGGGGQWNLLGTFSFNAGTSGTVVVDDDATRAPGASDDTTTVITGDAIKLVPVP